MHTKYEVSISYDSKVIAKVKSTWWTFMNPLTPWLRPGVGPFRLVWLLVCCLYKEVYLQFFKYVSFWLHGCCGEWEGGPVNQVNHTSWVVVVTPTDRPKSVRNCCLIELFCGVVCVVTLPFWHFCWCRGFCHRTGSDLFLFVLRSLWLACLIRQEFMSATQPTTCCINLLETGCWLTLDGACHNKNSLILLLQATYTPIPSQI